MREFYTYTLGMNMITRAIEIAGRSRIAEACGVSRVAVRHWEKNGRLPRTELTADTHYADTIADLTGLSADEIREWSHKAWIARVR